ncbi:alpha/beta fold hydrolase [Streptomyces polyrhachis]|uniref:Alpha/beta fold hydrolase n=1 Tax=Streptomyces polyrhachis TaxID=1282885 RepID=A0ABW2GJ67_9ACTN
MRTVQTAAGTVAWREVGEGPPLVLLHANLHDHRDFDPVLGALAREHRVLAVDWPGHGASGTDTTVGADRLARALGEFVDQLGLGPAVFIGNSVGGYAAARLAVERPEHVAALVLVNSGGFARRSALTRAYYRMCASSPAAGRLLPYVVRAYLRPAGEHDRAVAERVLRTGATAAGRATYRSMWRSFASPDFDLSGRADAIAAPTLVVWGRRDLVSPLHYGRVAHRLVPGARLAVLDTGHLPFSSAPGAFLDVVGPFLREVRAGVR